MGQRIRRQSKAVRAGGSVCAEFAGICGVVKIEADCHAVKRQRPKAGCTQVGNHGQILHWNCVGHVFAAVWILFGWHYQAQRSRVPLPRIEGLWFGCVEEERSQGDIHTKRKTARHGVRGHGGREHDQHAADRT